MLKKDLKVQQTSESGNAVKLPVGRSRRYWMIISRVEPLTKDAQLPIYWLKRIAEQDAETFGGTVVPVKITW
jgi:hypothetical protein